ncbi:E6 [Trichechus manatus papillomavirus]|nr:E6 [Trichechus manatus papillomavirus]
MDMPRTIQGLRDNFDLDYGTLLLACLLCKTQLTDYDMMHFEAGRFFLVWQEGLPWACCRRCIRWWAAVDRVCYYQYSASIADVEAETNLPFETLNVRCIACLRQLTHLDKLALSHLGAYLHRCRNKWRGWCNLCRCH